MMEFLFGLVVLWFVGYFCWQEGRDHQDGVQQREEQAAEMAYRWAVENDRLPTVVQYVDSETGEVIK